MNQSRPADEGQFVKAIAAALSPDGLVAALRIERANGQKVEQPFPTASAASIMLSIE